MDQTEELATCRRELQRLRAENDELRYSSESFGNLAERLNIALRTQRRTPAGSARSDAEPPHPPTGHGGPPQASP